jgi:hypothetical protein
VTDRRVEGDDAANGLLYTKDGKQYTAVITLRLHY